MKEALCAELTHSGNQFGTGVVNSTRCIVGNIIQCSQRTPCMDMGSPLLSRSTAGLLECHHFFFTLQAHIGLESEQLGRTRYSFNARLKHGYTHQLWHSWRGCGSGRVGSVDTGGDSVTSANCNAGKWASQLPQKHWSVVLRDGRVPIQL